MHQAPALELLAHRTGGQKSQAMTFQRHRLQALGHVGLVDGLKRRHLRQLAQDGLDHVAHVDARRISQQRR